MNIIDKIADAVGSLFLKNVENNKIFAEYYKRSKGIDYSRQAVNLHAKQISDYTRAMMGATDPDNPRRGELMRVYQSLLLDLHLQSCIENRILPVQCAPIKLVDKNDNEDTEAVKLLERPWYLNAIRMGLMGINFQGTTLMEMIELFNDGELKGELKKVTEIPQSNFIAPKGIVIKEEWDTEGISYKEGKYKNYYVQFGDDWNLGMLSILATIVLSKKLGIGSWISFIDKLGVPPVFAITERMDTTRRDELFDMLSNFRMNHFAVLQGNEKIEIPNNYNTDVYNSFDALAKRCDDYMSKYIQGGAGLTDQKSFVGSAEAQEKLLELRTKVDKLMWKFYFNTEIKPRLVSLSSVYAPLANLSLEYDESENLTLKEVLEAIKSLSQYYDFDVKELVKITGLPIIGIKSLFGSEPEPDPDDSEKKKTKQNNETNAGLKYAPFAHFSNQYLNDSIIYAATWDKAVEQLANDIWEGKAKAEDLNNDLVLKYYNALNKSAQRGWGKGYYTNDLTRHFRENLLKTSGAKSYNLIRHLEDLKHQSTDKESYINSSKKLINLHNETYQNVENKFTANSVSSARDFEQYMQDTDIYPNLKNRTMQDDSVRDSHAINDGVIKPANEWKQIPPYDPGCRCWLEQTDEEPTSRGLRNIDAKWANNPAISKQIFTDKNNYFTNIQKNNKVAVNQNTELMKEYMPYNSTVKSGEKTIYVNDFADRSDYTDNIKRAKLIAEELNKDVFIRPHFEGVAGRKSPEYGIGRQNILGDLKVLPKADIGNFFSNGVSKASKQSCKYTVMDISNYDKDILNLHTPIRDALFFRNGSEKNKNVERLLIIKNDKIIQLTRKEIKANKFDNLIHLKEKDSE